MRKVHKWLSEKRSDQLKHAHLHVAVSGARRTSVDLHRSRTETWSVKMKNSTFPSRGLVRSLPFGRITSTTALQFRYRQYRRHSGFFSGSVSSCCQMKKEKHFIFENRFGSTSSYATTLQLWVALLLLGKVFLDELGKLLRDAVSVTRILSRGNERKVRSSSSSARAQLCRL